MDKTNDLVKRPVNGHKTDASKAVAKNYPKTKPTISQNFDQKSTQEMKFGNKSVKKRVVPKDRENIPNISFITTEEFETIPQYLIFYNFYWLLTVGHTNYS